MELTIICPDSKHCDRSAKCGRQTVPVDDTEFSEGRAKAKAKGIAHGVWLGRACPRYGSHYPFIFELAAVDGKQLPSYQEHLDKKIEGIKQNIVQAQEEHRERIEALTTELNRCLTLAKRI